MKLASSDYYSDVFMVRSAIDALTLALTLGAYGPSDRFVSLIFIISYEWNFSFVVVWSIEQ